MLFHLIFIIMVRNFSHHHFTHKETDTENLNKFIVKSYNSYNKSETILVTIKSKVKQKSYKF